ncbi:hypothetical protein [Aestuariibaculum lutulentum]|uniref:Sulfotransferase domain-containing protein n=1 Tax=Aestuariibaculum lutulentum TaxID=2920935 RepID=A0ABS9RE71_9FLAO|nr:hypothetical protein [Aestuariibaculum lutulentum]MCH4551248.1 hypothetical protein [Aestuariibaculum lutulentum]
MNKIHIGYPKTASTFLQKHIYTQLRYHKFIGHKEFVESGMFDMLWKIERSIDYEKITRYLKGRAYFISFEEITGPSLQGAIIMDEMPLRLKKALNEDVKVLITIRRQDDLIKSIYLQYLHLGGTLRLKKVVNNPNFGQSRIDVNAYNFYETYKNYCRQFGPENVRVIPYELLKYDKLVFKDLLEDFFECESFNFEISKDENRSIKGSQINFLRFVNNFLSSWVSEKYIFPSKIFNQNNFRLRLQRSNFLRFGKSFNSEEAVFLKDILESFHSSNKLLDEELKLNLKQYGYY